MNILMWIIQIILGIKLMSVALTHGFGKSRPTMQEAIEKKGKLSRPLLTISAICTFGGTIGLVLPGVIGSSPKITSISASFMSILLLISILLHIKSREKPNILVSVILIAMAVFVAYGRWGSVS